MMNRNDWTKEIYKIIILAFITDIVFTLCLALLIMAIVSIFTPINYFVALLVVVILRFLA